MHGAEQARSDINAVLSLLVEHELLALPPSYAIRREVGPHRQVTWPASPRDTLRGKFGQFATLSEYRSLVENRQYNAVLRDGSMLMLSYQFSATGELEGHNLYYYPCPLDIERESDEGDGETPPDTDGDDLTFIDRFDRLLEDELKCALLETDIYEDTCVSRFLMRAPLRFDYAPDHAAASHAASHVHVAHPECRIPVFGPISVGHFVRFVFDNYYPGWTDLCGGFADVPDRDYGRELLDSHRGVFHIEWLTEAQRRQEGLAG